MKTYGFKERMTMTLYKYIISNLNIEYNNIHINHRDEDAIKTH